MLLFRYFPLLFLIYIVAEVFVTSYAFAHFPALWVVGFILFFMLIGVYLLKFLQFNFASSLFTLFATQANTKSLIKKNIFFILAALFFLIPAVLSSFIGVVMMLFALYLQLSDTISDKKDNKKQGDDDVIDAEIIDSNNDNSIANNNARV